MRLRTFDGDGDIAPKRVATDIKDQVVGRRLSPPAFDNSNYIKNQRGVPDLPRHGYLAAIVRLILSKTRVRLPAKEILNLQKTCKLETRFTD